MLSSFQPVVWRTTMVAQNRIDMIETAGIRAVQHAAAKRSAYFTIFDDRMP
jgi:hypothetical protein